MKFKLVLTKIFEIDDKQYNKRLFDTEDKKLELERRNIKQYIEEEAPLLFQNSTIELEILK